MNAESGRLGQLGRTRAQGARGFTLIEMLVVISIMGVLAALILPSMAHAKEKAKSLFCQNNLKQLNVALLSYCNYNNGSFPAIMEGPYYGYTLYPMEIMAKQMGLLNEPFSSGGTPPKVVLCPDCKITPGKNGEDFACRHYAWNSHLDSWVHSNKPGLEWEDYLTRVGRDSLPFGWRGYPWPEARKEYVQDYGLPASDYWCNFQPLKSGDVTAPSNVMTFMDSNDERQDYKLSDEEQEPYKYRWRTSAVCLYYKEVPNRHFNGGNMVFLDGHVEWKDREYLLVNKNQWDWLIRSDCHDTKVWRLSKFQ